MQFSPAKRRKGMDEIDKSYSKMWKSSKIMLCIVTVLLILTWNILRKETMNSNRWENEATPVPSVSVKNNKDEPQLIRQQRLTAYCE